MTYRQVEPAVFLIRPNRFIATVERAGQVETVHVKNTGRCRELLIAGRQVYLEAAGNTTRKTKYDLIAVEKPGIGLINIDSQAPNVAMKEWLEAQSPDVLRPEYPFGNSRLDFYMEKKGRKILIEVKGCTLERNGVGYFPDAPTERGRKHLRELAKATAQGYECVIAFVITMPTVREVRPNTETDPAFADALKAAKAAGVRVLQLPCHVWPAGVRICAAEPI